MIYKPYIFGPIDSMFLFTYMGYINRWFRVARVLVCRVQCNGFGAEQNINSYNTFKNICGDMCIKYLTFLR